MTTRFHFAFPVRDLEETEDFYVRVLGCERGRSAETWVDFNLGGNQLSAHVVGNSSSVENTCDVDGTGVPIPHFGLILEWSDWEALAARLEEHKVNFRLSPQVRFEGKPEEQATMFLSDPSGNWLEFKAFRNESSIF